MRILAVGSALPDHAYSQEQILERLEEEWGAQHYNPDRLRRLHENVLVGGRRLALPMEEYENLSTFGDANDAWIRVAVELGAAAVERALEASALPRERLGAFFSATVTGVAVPSLEARIMQRSELPRDLRRVPIFGLGCVAGAAGVARAADWVRGAPDRAALMLSVELCSLTLQRRDLSIPNLIASGLFGDGAAAVVVAGAALAEELGTPAHRGPEIVDSVSVLYPDSERVMGWDVSEEGFKVVLSAEVPEMVRRHLRSDVDGFLGRHALDRSDIRSWVCHPGGPKVLVAMQEALEIDEEDLRVTWDGLRRVGNLSSTSVLLALEETLDRARPERGSWGMMLAMGPGFCSELVLLRW